AAIAEGAAGKKSTVKVALLLAAGLVLGLAVGYFVSSLAGERQQFNLALRDAKDIYSAVQGARSVMEQTQTAIDATLAAAKGQGGAAPRVDYAAIERLRALKKPFDAGQFARKRYLAFEGTTVDDLFAYYNNINLMWDKIERLAARTLSEQRRKALDASAATAEVVATPTGCVPTTVEGRTMCGLVFLAPKEGSEDAVLVRSSLRSSQTVEKKIFREGTSLGDAPSDYVFIVDPTKSAGVLGQGASEFAIYVGEISDLKALVVQTMEIQGRLEQGLGKVARLNEL
ncbi:MAG: hypothetical protein KC417_15910, partial [Myxococcales bacterium]|nr:hypothetical protein [Myxococcales bacterium]